MAISYTSVIARSEATWRSLNCTDSANRSEIATPFGLAMTLVLRLAMTLVLQLAMTD